MGPTWTQPRASLVILPGQLGYKATSYGPAEFTGTFVLGTYSTRCCLECWTNDYGILKHFNPRNQKNALTTNVPTHQAHIAGLISRD